MSEEGKPEATFVECPLLSDSVPATPGLVRDLVSALPESKDPLLLLVRSDHHYMQALWHASGWILELREGGPEQHYRAEGLDSEAVQSALCDYSVGENTARAQLGFESVDLESEHSERAEEGSVPVERGGEETGRPAQGGKAPRDWIALWGGLAAAALVSWVAFLVEVPESDWWKVSAGSVGIIGLIVGVYGKPWSGSFFLELPRSIYVAAIPGGGAIILSSWVAPTHTKAVALVCAGFLLPLAYLLRRWALRVDD